MNRMHWGALMLALLGLTALPTLAVAQDHGEGQGGGGAGCGDAFGDLIHIKRHAGTGQPILAKRWVELPKDAPGYGWGYCPIAVDELGNELRFADLSCDVDLDDIDKVVEVDYFGRLNGGRTKERNQRMHFNEVIDNIKSSCSVKQDETGRLKIGYCDDRGKLEEWATIDSPMESMGLYVRLMKYGHIQTDPNEVDYWAHGDPATMPQLQPALGPEDWLKFHSSVQHLLPGWVKTFKRARKADSPFEIPWVSACFSDDDGDGLYEVTEPFTDSDKDGNYTDGEPYSDLDGDAERDAFTEFFEESCALPESLTSEDFARAGFFMAGAANKTGQITEDLTQYFNRIVKITKKTAHTAATPDTLPALVRICTVEGDLDPDDENQGEPTYTGCSDQFAGGAWLDNAELYPDVTERFVDFSQVEYDRLEWRDETVEGVFPVDVDGGFWQVYSKPLGMVVPLTGWLAYINGPDPMNHAYYDPTFGIRGFVECSRDGLRSIEFVHNYAVPVDLWPEYFAVSPKEPVMTGLLR